MKVVCFDLEGVLVPEFWEEFSKMTGIPELMKTTRDEPNYDKLMKMRIAVLEKHHSVENPALFSYHNGINSATKWLQGNS